MGGYTEPDEIRAEIERRRKRAQDLEMRELVWGFYYYNLSSLPEKLKKDPATVLPELKETLEISGSTFQFRFGESSFRLIYKELSTETDHYGRNRMDDMTTTRANIALDANDKRVFDFKMTRMVTYTPDMPLFSESMGEISAFIE